MAKRFGVTDTIVGRGNEETPAQLMALTGDPGTDYALELVGGGARPKTAEPAFNAMRMGGTRVLAGLAPDDITSMPINPRLLMTQQKRVVGALFCDSQFRKDVPRYVALYLQGRINLDDMVSRGIGLAGINDAVREMIAGDKVARQVIRF